MATNNGYRRLPGSFRGFFRRNTLWLGEDHVLLVDSSRFSETYKRFYLPDIQAIIIRKTPRFVIPYYWYFIALGAMVFVATGMSQPHTRTFWPGIIMVSAVAVYGYVICIFQSCRCHLITRVSRVELKALYRLRSARKFVDMLGARIAGVQGNLPEDWVERSFMLTESSTAADRNPDAVELSAGTFSWAPVLAFFCVLTDAWFTWMGYKRPEVNVFSLTALGVFGTIAIFRLWRVKGAQTLRILVMAALCVMATVKLAGAVMRTDVETRILGATEIVLDPVIAIPGLILAFGMRRGPQGSVSLFDSGDPRI